MDKKKRLILKTYRKIDKVAKNGKEAIFDYKKLIDDIVLNGEYQYLNEAMFKYYNIDISTFDDIDSMKNNTFDIIRFNTKSTYEEKVKTFLQLQGVYQVGRSVYLNDNTYIGDSYQEGDDYLIRTSDNIIETLETLESDLETYKSSILKLIELYGN